MNCLVLGGAGFIGSHIVDALIFRGHAVRVFDLPNISPRNIEGNLSRVEMVGGDFNNIHDVSPALDDIDVVVHLVCTTLPGPSNENPTYDVESNVIATLNILEKAVQKGVRKIIFPSSGGTVYGIPDVLPVPETHRTDPICSYGITKLTIEKYLSLFHHLYGLEYVILRVGNPYGERQRIDSVQGVIGVFLGKILLGEEITVWGDGSIARDYLYQGDLVSAFVRTIESDTPSRIYNIAGGRAHTVAEILSTIRAVTGEEPRVRFTPPRRLDVPVSCLDISRAAAELGWSPTTALEEGIEKTWRWMKTSGRAHPA